MASRLGAALDHGLVLPDPGRIAVLHPTIDTDLGDLPRDRVLIVQPFRPWHDAFRARGFEVAPELTEPCAAAIVVVPRSKALARALVHLAATCAEGQVIVEGGKSDGIDSVLKDIRKRVPVAGQVSKAHGRVFWFAADAADFADWQDRETVVGEGFVTLPGVFSADGIDPASRLLADALPVNPGRRVADLGAGWGYLAARILADTQVQVLDLVEADRRALDCARRNVTDPRARFHWADATVWHPADGPLDTVVMNPPFHAGRAADTALGAQFIEAAARLLTPSGTLWMVANRHLPYEAVLAQRFSKSGEIAGDGRFKVIRAERPRRPSRPRR